jgi:hypothetical protein
MKKQITLLTFILFLSGCATIVSDSEYKIKLKSYPESADFVIRDEDNDIVEVGKTPQRVKLDAGNGYFDRADYLVEYTFPGDTTKYEKDIESEIDNWYWGNILFGGIIGMLIVDPLNGSMYELPEKVILSKPNS